MSAAYRPLTLGILAIVSCSAFEALAVNTAMPVVAGDLSAGAGYGLAFSMYFTTSLVGTVVAGSRCDAEGPRRVLAAGMVLMVAGLLVSALAGAFWMVTAGRAVSGLGGGAVSVALYVVIGEIYPRALQPAVFGWLAAAWVLPSLIGPLVAGLLAQYVSWRWVFAGVIPLILLAGAAVVPRIRPPGAERAPADAPAPAGRAAWATVLAAGTFAAQWAGVRTAVSGGQAVLPWVLAVSGAVVAAVALVRLLPAGTLRLRRGLPSVIAARGLMNASFVAADSFLPLMLVSGHGVTPATAGLALTAGAVGWALGSYLQARVAVRRHMLLVIGASVLAAAIAGSSLLTSPSAPFGAVVLVWSLAGLAMGTALPSTSVMVLSLSSQADRGRNSSSLHVSDQVGGVAGTTAAGVLFALLQAPAAAGEARTFSAIWLALSVFAALAIVAGARSAVSNSTTGKVQSSA